MKKDRTAQRKRALVSLLSLLAAAALTALGMPPRGHAAGKASVEMPRAMQPDGVDPDAERQRQIELTRSLLADLPSAPGLEQAHVVLSRDDLDAMTADATSLPLRIGLVKGLAPAVEIFGLDTAAGITRPRQGRGGVAVRTADGGWVWALVVSAEGAGAVRLHVEGMDLPKGVSLHVYSRSGEVYGPYTGAGPDRSGEFWTTSIFGTEAILQLRAPNEGALRDVTFRVGEVGIIGEAFVASLVAPEAAAFCGHASCIVDASCYSQANSIRDAYAKMEWVSGPYIYTCTGGLLNDSNPTQDNFFLTANHCLSKNQTAQNVSFYWRFRTLTCNGSCPSSTGWPYKTTGSSLKVSNRRGDFTLLQLNANPPAGSVFMGWTNAPVANTNGVALHRVSNPGFGPQVYSEHTVSTSRPTCQGWPRGERIYSVDQLGATAGGSSGSPVVNALDQVVGQLSGKCGSNPNNACDPAANATVDGAFAYYWTSVRPYLQP